MNLSYYNYEEDEDAWVAVRESFFFFFYHAVFFGSIEVYIETNL